MEKGTRMLTVKELSDQLKKQKPDQVVMIKRQFGNVTGSIETELIMPEIDRFVWRDGEAHPVANDATLVFIDPPPSTQIKQAMGQES